MVNPTSCAPEADQGDAHLDRRAPSTRRRSASRSATAQSLPLKPQAAHAADGPRADDRRQAPRPAGGVDAGAGPGEPARRPGQAAAVAGARSRTTRSRTTSASSRRASGSNCPPSSIVGQASRSHAGAEPAAEGPVYFVKNVRIDPKTGRQIRTLPTLLIPLRGEVALDLRATTTVIDDKLVSTFPTVPDAPVSRFELNLKGGSEGHPGRGAQHLPPAQGPDRRHRARRPQRQARRPGRADGHAVPAKKKRRRASVRKHRSRRKRPGKHARAKRLVAACSALVQPAHHEPGAQVVWAWYCFSKAASACRRRLELRSALDLVRACTSVAWNGGLTSRR